MRAIVLLAAGLLAGCQTTEPSAEVVWQRYVGRPVTDLVLKAGPPSAQFAMGDGRQAFQWKASGAITEGYANVAQTRVATCVITFYATKVPGEGYSGWRVVGFAPAGANC